MDENTYRLFTDGSCLGNPGKGGTGVYLKFPEEFELEDLKNYRGYHNTKNNRMELKASIDGLKMARVQIKKYGYKPLKWYTDSRYIVDNFYNVEKWKKNNKWIRSNGEPVLNPDLWRELYNLAASMRVSPSWVSREKNEEADKLARQGSKNPTHTDLGYNPGRVGTSLGGKSEAPNLFNKNEHVLVRIYRGDGMISKTDQRCKIRFEEIDVKGGSPIKKYYAYTEEEIYNKLHRTYEYMLNVLDGNIIEIVEEL